MLKTLGKELLDDGRLDELDTQEWKEDHTISKKICSIQSKSLKQKLFDYVHQSECAERQGGPYSLKWVLKNKGEKVRARLVVREIKKAKSGDEKLEPSDVFSAMPLVESLKALVQSRDDGTS